MVAKLHLRKQLDGSVYFQGVIPESQAGEVEFADQIASGDVFLVLVKDRTKEYKAKSNIEILEMGMP